MAFNGTFSIPPRTWLKLNQTAVSALRADNQGAYGIHLQGTVGAVEPTSRDGSVFLEAGKILAADISLAQLFPGIVGANYLWAWHSGAATVRVSVSHG